MKKDISNREDIDRLMHLFYNRLLEDASISYIFTDVAKIDLETHIPHIADFWESVLFLRNVYKNNPVRIHMELNRKTPLLPEHFKTWLAHFDRAVDELFEGSVAILAKERAQSIATVMQIKMLQQSQ